jgi:hypothetical protein
VAGERTRRRPAAVAAGAIAPTSSRMDKDRGRCGWLQWVPGEVLRWSTGQGDERVGELHGGGNGSSGGAVCVAAQMPMSERARPHL